MDKLPWFLTHWTDHHCMWPGLFSVQSGSYNSRGSSWSIWWIILNKKTWSKCLPDVAKLKIVFGESICCYLGHPLVMTGSDVFPFPSWKGWKLFLRWISVDVLTKKERVYVMRGIFILMMKIICLHIFTFATNPNIIT